MAIDINYEAKKAVASAIATLEDNFAKVDEMDKLLGLATEDKMKALLETVFSKYAVTFASEIQNKGANTSTPASIQRFTALFCYFMGLNVLDLYKDIDAERINALFEYVTPFAAKIVVEMEKNPQPMAQIEGMLKNCVDRFCKEFGEK